MPGAGRSTADAKTLATTAGYWQGDYDAVAENPEAKLLAANAAYRNMRKAGGSWQAVVGRMDSLVKQYAEILREDPSNTEAAFNYEYVVRLRAGDCRAQAAGGAGGRRPIRASPFTASPARRRRNRT